jgi:hypothetical protein
MRELVGVEYCCLVSWCGHNFGDPDSARAFDVWDTQVRTHLHNSHNATIPPNAYLNDFLRPVYSTAHGDRPPADRARS